MRILILLIAGVTFGLPAEETTDTDGDQTRKILGSSVVTSVSVIMDTGNGSKTVFTDAVGKPVPKPSSGSELASPIDLLNPDRYEFYTFDDNGDLVKRLMSLEEIQGIIATGDSDGFDLDSFTSQGYLPEKKVNDVVNNVQNVLKEEMETHKDPPNPQTIFDTPDVSDSWSMILPAVFGNSGEDIKPEKPITHVTPDTIMIEPNGPNAYLISSSEGTQPISSTMRPFKETVVTSPRSTTSASTPRSSTTLQISSFKPDVISTPPQISTTEKLVTLKQDVTTEKFPTLTTKAEEKVVPMINVEIYSNSKSTQKPIDSLETESAPLVEIKPLNITKNDKPNYVSNPTTKRPSASPSTVQVSLETSTQAENKTTYALLTTQKTTLSPLTFMTFQPISMSSTLPTTKYATKPTTPTKITTVSVNPTTTTPKLPFLTVHSTEMPLSTWRPELSNVKVTTPLTTVKEPSISTQQNIATSNIPKPTTEYIQSLNNLPTLAELLNSRPEILEDTKETIIVPQTIIPDNSFTINGGNNKEGNTTIEYITQESIGTQVPEKEQSTEKSDEDLSTLSSEYFSANNNALGVTSQIEQQTDATTNHFSLDQALNNAQKISASELLDQLLLTTNIYEINTELAEKFTEQQTFNNDDERFETTTLEESKLTEVKTEPPTTTEFMVNMKDNIEQPSNDKTIINSIEELLSQAVGNVEETLSEINNTQQIESMLLSSNKKNMTELQMETATIASNIVNENLNVPNVLEEEGENVTTEINMLEAIPSDEVSVLSDSVGSLLSQIYVGNEPGLTTIEQFVSTVKYPVTSTNTSLISNRKTENETDIIMESSTTSDSEFTEPYNEFVEQKDVTTQIIDIEVNNANNSASYMPLDTVNKNNIYNKSDDEFVPHLINITIISSESIKNRTKPAKADISLEQIYNDEDNKNYTMTSLQDDATEIYIEKVSIASNLNDKTSTEKTPSELLKAEESNSGVYNNSETNKNSDKSQIKNIEEAAKSQADDLVVTTESFIPLKEITKTEDRPTTIIIIKRTEKPNNEPTTVNPERIEEESTNILITTTTDEKLLETTTLFNQVETTELVTDNLIPLKTEIIQKISNAENSTEELLEPSIEILINEDNKPFSDNIQSSTPNNLENQTNEASFNKTDLEVNTTSNKENITSSESFTDKIIINENVTANKDIKLETDIADKILKNNSESIQSNATLKGEITAENKPESMWTLVPTIPPHTEEQVENYSQPIQQFPEIIEPPSPVDLTAKPLQGFGLEDSTSRLDTDIYQFSQLCNELAFGFWKTVASGISSARSVFVSPFGATSLLAMVFLGARGATSGEMNEILKLDDMVTFNPHLIFKTVSESIKPEEQDSGIISSAIIRELFSDRSKGKLLPFYKERVRAFYDGYVEEVGFREIGDVIRRRTNLQVKKYTNGKITEYLKDSSIVPRSPLAGISVNIFQTDCSKASMEGRDGEIHFVVLPSIRQRRLIPIPAVVYKSGFLAGYEPSLDATAVSLGTKDQTISTILVIPGQQGIAAPGDGLARLEKRLVESSFKKGAWSRLLRSLIPRPGLEVQIPRFAHKSLINATVALKKMGLHDLFDVDKADLRGLNGIANELYLSDMLQVNSFATCGEQRIGDAHHTEIYPAVTAKTRNSRYLENYQSDNIYYRGEVLLEEPRDYQRAFADPLHDPSYLSLPLPLRPRQARVPEIPRLRFDRPFIYFVRHNPTGLILHMGRFNPRLLP